MDQHCADAAGVLVMNRIKLHTGFSGQVQSGLTKMMVVGMGKINSAQTFHNTPSSKMNDMLLEMGHCILNHGNILGGLALLEDGEDQLAEIHAIPGTEILNREPELVERHRSYFPSLPTDSLDLLVINEIGKNFSGTGMDTNVIGYRGIKGAEDIESPNIERIAALNLSSKSQGNAIGIGLADFITQRLRDDMDEHKTFTNVFTTGDMQRMKIPCTFASDQILLEKLKERFGEGRWMFIPNTLHLDTFYVSEALLEEMENHSRCTVDKEPIEQTFCEGRITLFQSTHDQ